MSRVTNVLVVCSVLESEDDTDTVGAIQRINANTDFSGHLTPLHDFVKGPKSMEVYVFGAAYNHLFLGDLFNEILAAPWLEPDYVLVVVAEQEDDRAIPWTLAEIKKRLVSSSEEKGNL
jgi:hypothetical protein